MSKFAYFNPHDGRILQWIDTDTMAYNLPDASLLHECTDAEWEMRDAGESMVKDGVVVQQHGTKVVHVYGKNRLEKKDR